MGTGILSQIREVHWVPTPGSIAAENPCRIVFTLLPKTRLPRIFLLIMPSLWRISG